MTIDEDLIAKMSADKEFVAEARQMAACMCLSDESNLRDCSDEEIVRLALEASERLYEAVMTMSVPTAEAARALHKFGVALNDAKPTIDEFCAALKRRDADPSA